mmetsp:Transcript_95227/g.199157  ORF Transcript_95227/g.199157 Transcript_95227/m.199157 type:complete len:328 (-) Transcript_95227:179-1162(-)
MLLPRHRWRRGAHRREAHAAIIGLGLRHGWQKVCAFIRQSSRDARRRKSVKNWVTAISAEVSCNGHLSLRSPLRHDSSWHNRHVACNSLQVGHHVDLHQSLGLAALRGLVIVDDTSFQEEFILREAAVLGLRGRDLVVLFIVIVVVLLVISAALLGLGLGLGGSRFILIVILVLVIIVFVFVVIIDVFGLLCVLLCSALLVSAQIRHFQGGAHAERRREVPDQDTMREDVGSLFEGILHGLLLVCRNIYVNLCPLSSEVHGSSLLDVPCDFVRVGIHLGQGWCLCILVFHAMGGLVMMMLMMVGCSRFVLLSTSQPLGPVFVVHMAC